MTARPDDWEILSAQWRALPSETPIAIDRLRRTVRHRQRELIALLAGEVLVTLLVAGAILRVLRGGFTRATVTTAVLLFLWTAFVWAFTIWNRRGIWRPLTETTKEYLRLSRQRVAAGRRTVFFVRVTMSVYAVAYGGWFVARLSRHPLDFDERVIWLLALAYCVLLLAWSVWYARRLTGELERIGSIERSLGLSGAA